MGVRTQFTKRVAGAILAELARQGMDGIELTGPLQLSRNSVYARLRGEKALTTDEIALAADFLGVDVRQLVAPVVVTPEVHEPAA